MHSHEEHFENRRLALQIAASINKKEVDIPCMVGDLSEQGSVKVLLSDAEKIYHWLTKEC